MPQIDSILIIGEIEIAFIHRPGSILRESILDTRLTEIVTRLVLVILRRPLLPLLCFSLLRFFLVFLSDSLLFLLLKLLLFILLEVLYLLHFLFRISI